jgi:hypothetical protein
MARQRADQPENAQSDLGDELPAIEDDSAESEDDAASERPAEVEEFWAKARVDPVEIALPRGVGYTLRAYRMNDTLPQELLDEADDTEETDDLLPVRSTDDDDRLDELDEEYDEDEEDDDEADETTAVDEDEDDDEDAEPEPEEVPVFLTQGRRLLLFRSPEGLIEFVRSAESSSFQAIPEWEKTRSDIGAQHIVVADEDRYELDLVVENLRGGHDAWDAELLIKAGEICRDLGHALRLESVIDALSAGSPLDDLDEALRAGESGRLTAFFARRRLRRVGAQQAALAWRSIIGKISTSVDWRD